MKRFVQWFATLCLIAVASTAMAADPVVVAMTYTLDVTAVGRGRVISNPEGIDCDSDGITQTGTCSANFTANTVVALKATPPPADDNGSYFFCNWNSDFDNSIDVYGFVMDGAKTEKEYATLKEYLSSQRFFHPKNPVESYAQAALIYFACRRKGITVRSTIDCLIAQIALEHDLFLLHNDSDFIAMAPVIGLRLI